MKLTLTRRETSDNGTFGGLTNEEGEVLGVTCERPDNGNQKMGCIPPGVYKTTFFISPSKGKVFLLHNVPNRSMIEIHVGNTIKDTQGCILLGLAFGTVDGLPAVVNSRLAMRELIAKYPTGFDLEIIGV